MSKLLAATAVALLVLAIPAAAQRNRRVAVPPPDLKHGTYESKKFHSVALEREVPYGIYLPLGYADAANRERRYPLVVWLHGLWEDHKRFHERGGSQALDDLIGSKDVPELILVCPSPGRTSFYLNGKSSGRVADMITTDLLAHVEATYRVETDRGRRALMGVSMGGMGALAIAFKHPDRFGTVATHSAAVFPPDLDQLTPVLQRMMKSQWVAPVLEQTFGDPIDEELWQANNPLSLVALRSKDELARLAVYFDAGTADRYEFHKTNEMLHEALQAKGIEHTWRKIEGGGHSWGDGLAATALHESLRFVAQQFARASGQAGLRNLLLPKGSSGEEHSPGSGR